MSHVLITNQTKKIKLGYESISVDLFLFHWERKEKGISGVGSISLDLVFCIRNESMNFTKFKKKKRTKKMYV